MRQPEMEGPSGARYVPDQCSTGSPPERSSAVISLTEDHYEGVEPTVNGCLAPHSALTEHTDLDFGVSDETRRLILDGIAKGTQDAYRKAWSKFTAWCRQVGRVELPATAQTLADYVAHLAGEGMSPNTVSQAINAVRTIHRYRGYKDQPDAQGARGALKGYRVRWAEDDNRVRKAPPILVDALKLMVDTCDLSTPTGIRNRLVLVLGWAMMARRSEVANLMDHDVQESPQGLLVYVAHSKTDRQAQGEEVPIPFGENPKTDPVRAVRVWREVLAGRDISGGRLLRSIDRWGNIGGNLPPATVGRIAKEAVAAAGLPQAEAYSFHGMRSGGATQAYKNGRPISAIAQHGRWVPTSAVVLGYIRAVDKWKDNPMRGIGL